MKRIARFEIISYKQWEKDLEGMLQSNHSAVYYGDLQIPVRKTKGSAGYDFIAPFDLIIQPHSDILIKTGIKCQIEEGYVLELYPRSSLGFKHRLALNNTVGIIDSDYYNNVNNEGHIMCKMYNPTNNIITIHKGEAFAQGIFKQFFLADEEEVTTERVGGIGSTNS